MKKHYLHIKLFIFIFQIIFFLQMNFGFAQTKISPKAVAVFTIPNNNNSDIILTAETANKIKKVFIDCGRFMPVDDIPEALFNKAKNESGGDGRDIFNKTAQFLNCDIYVLVSSYQTGNMFYSDVAVVPVNQEYKSLEKIVKLRSKIKLNIPLKAGIEIALLHKNIPVNASVVKSFGNETYLISAGQWQGIKNDEVYKLPESDIRVIQTGRFESIVKSPAIKKEGESIVIKIFPDIDKIFLELDNDISRNTVNRYELAQGTDGKRLLEGICVVNIGGNICVPGYGAFLSTSYLGFKDPKPDWPGITVSATVIGMQFLLPELMTDFKINFFPWEQDSSKTGRMQDLQKFLWITLPVTFSTAYMDQLANQFRSTEHLPPFFNDKDNMAAVFSLFIPGGGLFYKAHRLAGWGFYFSEMSAAGYAVYNYEKKSGKCALIALGALKLADIIYAYIIRTSYSFYNLEKERQIEPAFLNMGFNTGPDHDRIYNLMVTKTF
ncbi:MAG: hypothetical protein V1874_07595 [Spirochaetota bacterium]